MELHKTQIIVAQDSHRFRVLCSGRQWGKTTLAVQEMLAYAYYKSGSRVCYIAPTFTQARDIAWTLLKDATRLIQAKEPNESRLELVIETRDAQTSEIWLRGYENIEGLRGQQFDFLVIDEVAMMRNWRYGWDAVLEPTLLIRKGQALFISTPNGYNHFYDLYQREKKDSDYKSFTFTSYDNPYADQTLLDKKRTEEAGSLEYFEQEYLAKFNKLAGAVYKEWDETKQFIPFSYNPELPTHISWDFGVNDPTVVLVIQPVAGEYRLVDYLEAANSNIHFFVDWLRGHYPKIELETGDIAGRQRSLLTGKSVIDELRELGHFVRTMPIPEITQQVRNAHRYIPKLLVSSSNPRCLRFKECLLNYHYPDKSTNLVNQDNEDPMHDEYSHAMRAFEYYCWNQTSGDLGAVKQRAAENVITKMFHPADDQGQLISIDPDRIFKW